MQNIFDGKKVLVVGSCGFVGMNLVHKLLSFENIKIRATYHNFDLDFNKFITKDHPIVKEVEEDKIVFKSCDLLKMKDCEKITTGIDYIFMCAAVTGGAGLIMSDPVSLVRQNLVMNANLLEAANKAGVKKYIFISSNTAYKDMGNLSASEDVAFVGDPMDIYFGIGWVKRSIEKLCQFYAEKIEDRMDCICLRSSNLYGENDHFKLETCHVIPALINKIVNRHDPVEVWGDGSNTKDFLYVGDLIDLMILCVERKSGFSLYNAGFGVGWTIKDIVKMICEIDNYVGEIKYNKDKPSMIAKRLFNVSKAKKELGFEAKIGMKEGLERTVNWYKESLE